MRLRPLEQPVVTGPADLPAILEERPPATQLRDEPRISGPDLTIVVPTLNERDNVEPLIERLDRLLRGVDWEAVFVDDNLSDGTAEHFRLGRADRRIRCIRRLGRRGLSSACIEGMLSSSAPYLAVIDGDLQHDESLLPRMLEVLRRQPADLVVATRYMGAGAAAGAGFVGAQSLATMTAMVWNYFLNNSLTYREYRLVGWKALSGLASFMAICGLGAVVNVLVARDLYAVTHMWLLAGAGGAVVGALLNYALTSMFTWRRRPS